MKSNTKYYLVLITAPDLRTARRLVRTALSARLVACANLVPRLESHYWWQGTMAHSPEVLIVFKTTGTRLPALERLVINAHPYDTPEFIAFRLAAGNRRYLAWLAASTGESQKPVRKSPDKESRGARRPGS